MKISYNGLTVEVDEKDMTPEQMASHIDAVVKKGRELSGTQGCSLQTTINGSDLAKALNVKVPHVRTFPEGGIIEGPNLTGESPLCNDNPEVIAPLSKVQDYITHAPTPYK